MMIYDVTALRLSNRIELNITARYPITFLIFRYFYEIGSTKLEKIWIQFDIPKKILEFKCLCKHIKLYFLTSKHLLRI